MKPVKLFSLVLSTLLIFGLAGACEKNQEFQEQDGPVQEAGVEFRQAPDFEDVAQFMAQNGMSNGAFFIDPSFPGQSWSVLKDVVFDPVNGFSFKAVTFQGVYGNGDFWRVNPDGTVTVKLTDNQAAAEHFVFPSGELHLGTGNLNVKFTGNPQTFQVPFPPFELTFINFDPSQNAQVIHGQAQVTLNGDPAGEPRRLRMWWNANPGGQSMVDFVLAD